MPRVAAAAKSDVVFCFSYLTWEGCVRAGGFHSEARFAQTLLDDGLVRRTLICNTIRSLPRKVAADTVARARGTSERFPGDDRRRLLEPVRLRRHEPTSIKGVARAIARYDRALRIGAERAGFRKPVVIVSHPLLAGFADFSWAGSVTFYATDDWTAYPPARRWWDAYRESYARVRASDRRVGAVSQALLERIEPRGASAVVPNGLDPNEWIEPARAPEWLARLPRPILLYAGTLDSRLDVPGLLALARQKPHATLLLVGPLVEPGHLEPLHAAGNVVVRPPIGREELVGLVQAADVGMIPHVRSPLTEAMSPLKLYEYLGAGLPVVATDLAPMRSIDRRVLLVPAGREYAPAVDTAVELGRASEEARIGFVEANSWRTRHRRLLELALA
ncbi:MAG TPA: glycosyltransferase [Solirubrobacteraceae bacterium]|nr:glycosyltransferase [Solirubrobacteraceae bacterium]